MHILTDAARSWTELGLPSTRVEESQNMMRLLPRGRGARSDPRARRLDLAAALRRGARRVLLHQLPHRRGVLGACGNTVGCGTVGIPCGFQASSSARAAGGVHECHSLAVCVCERLCVCATVLARSQSCKEECILFAQKRTHAQPRNHTDKRATLTTHAQRQHTQTHTHTQT